ncbi:WbqC family protein [Marinobacterium sp. xm-d-530]|uniref:WbqC family protein n=1 Tax=Marinobacterium sp. xm-d-530 TaxID=2497747 RepID=UPI001567E7E3|nr:WbqC-like protein family protein [Marinobacterium sp. xm-d-530]
MIKVSIHQPNFFPWLGYFSKIINSDIFIFLDDAQYPKKGGSWSNRVKLPIAGQPQWVTMPISRSYSGTKTVAEVNIANDKPWREKLSKTVAGLYGRAPYYTDVAPFFENVLCSAGENVADFNISVIEEIIKFIEVPAPQLLRSSAYRVESTATQRLVDLISKVGGDAYLCGAGSDGYLEPEIFRESNIQLIYHNYSHPVYQQCHSEEFIGGLSILDSLMNLGPDAVRKILIENP